MLENDSIVAIDRVAFFEESAGNGVYHDDRRIRLEPDDHEGMQGLYLICERENLDRDAALIDRVQQGGQLLTDHRWAADLPPQDARQHEEGTFFETGRVAGTACSVAIVRVGPGNTATALIAERAIGMFRPRALLFVGVAGALRDDVRLGDVVVATRIYAFQGGKSEGNGFLARPQMWEAHHGLEQLAGHLAREGRWTNLLTNRRQQPTVHLKPIASGEVVVNSRIGPVAEHLRAHFSDAVAVDMESVGLACTGHLNRSMPVLSVRGISDLADGGKHLTDRAGWQGVAAAHAAAFALTMAIRISL